MIPSARASRPRPHKQNALRLLSCRYRASVDLSAGLCRYQPRRFASASAATSRRSVLICRRTRRTSARNSDRRRPPRGPRLQRLRHPLTLRAASSRIRSGAGPGTPPSGVSRSSPRAARARPRPSASTRRIWLVRAVQIDGTILHGWLLLLSALFPQGVTPFVERKLPRGSSQPLHLISVFLSRLCQLHRLPDGPNLQVGRHALEARARGNDQNFQPARNAIPRFLIVTSSPVSASMSEKPHE